jgi:transposase
MAMTIVETTRLITGGVDTHLDVHVAAAVDANGGVLGVESFATTPAAYVELHGWLAGFGTVDRVGVEGTGAYGAGLARHLRTSRPWPTGFVVRSCPCRGGGVRRTGQYGTTPSLGPFASGAPTAVAIREHSTRWLPAGSRTSRSKRLQTAANSSRSWWWNTRWPASISRP